MVVGLVLWVSYKLIGIFVGELKLCALSVTQAITFAATTTTQHRTHVSRGNMIDGCCCVCGWFFDQQARRDVNCSRWVSA